MKTHTIGILGALAAVFLIVLYKWHFIKIITLGAGIYRLKYKAGLRWGQKDIDLNTGNFSTITLANGFSIVPIDFDNQITVELTDKNGNTLETVSLNKNS